jgi:hypothetical protein
MGAFQLIMAGGHQPGKPPWSAILTDYSLKGCDNLESTFIKWL